MVRLVARKLLLLVVLLPLLNAVGFWFAHTFVPPRLGPQLGVDVAEQKDSFVDSYGAYVERVAHGDWGAVQSLPIERYLATLLGRSAVLLGFGLLLTMLLGPLLGVAAVAKHSGRIHPFAQTVLVLGSSLPGLFLGSLLIGGLLYLSRSGIFGGQGTALPIQGYGLDAHLLVPLVTLASRPIFFVAYLVAGLLEHELQQDYVRVARSKGLGGRGLLWRHAVPNMLVPVAVALGQAVRLLVGGLILTEALFDWRGIGWLFLMIMRLDAYGTSAVVGLNPELLAYVLMIFGALLLIADLLSGVAAYLASPQARRAEAGLMAA